MVRRFVEQQDVGLLQEQAGERHAAPFAAGDHTHRRVGRRTTEGVHRLFDLRGDVPGAEPVDLFLEFTLLRENPVLRRVVGRLVQLVPGGVVGGHEVGEGPHPLLDALAHRLRVVEQRLLCQQADPVARLEMHVALELPIGPRQDPQQ